MRILQVVHGLPPEEQAGTELVTLSLARALQQRGHEVAILARIADAQQAEFSLFEERKDNIDIFRMVNSYTKTTSFQLLYENSFCDEPFLRVVRRVRPDVVHFQHVHHLSASLLSLAADLGYPTVLSLHDFYFACHLIHLIDTRRQLCAGPERGERCVSCLREVDPTGEVRRRFPFMAKALQEPDLVLAPSRFLAERMLSYFPELEGRLRVVPLGVERPNCSPISRSFTKPLRILCVGVLIPHKGAHVLLEAIQGLPSEAVEVSLYGAVSSYWQPYVDQLHELAKGSSVHFRGVYDHAELAGILAQHDVLVMPGICEETFSLMTREALLAGLPVIVARRGALLEAIQDGKNGFFFDPESPEDLRRCLRQLVENPGLLARLRESQPQVRTVVEYTEEMEAIYREVCDDTFRVEVLQQRLFKHRDGIVELRQQNTVLQKEVETWRAQYVAIEEQRSCEVAGLLNECNGVRAALREKERQLEEHHVRLQAIYRSTTWRLHNLYVLLGRLVQCPLRSLRRWLVE